MVIWNARKKIYYNISQQISAKFDYVNHLYLKANFLIRQQKYYNGWKYRLRKA